MTENKPLSEMIAELSASKDPSGTWWGYDTDVGNLPTYIEELLGKYTLDKSKVREAINKIMNDSRGLNADDLLKELGLDNACDKQSHAKEE